MTKRIGIVTLLLALCPGCTWTLAMQDNAITAKKQADTTRVAEAVACGLSTVGHVSAPANLIDPNQTGQFLIDVPAWKTSKTTIKKTDPATGVVTSDIEVESHLNESVAPLFAGLAGLDEQKFTNMARNMTLTNEMDQRYFAEVQTNLAFFRGLAGPIIQQRYANPAGTQPGAAAPAASGDLQALLDAFRTLQGQNSVINAKVDAVATRLNTIQTPAAPAAAAVEVHVNPK